MVAATSYEILAWVDMHFVFVVASIDVVTATELEDLPEFGEMHYGFCYNINSCECNQSLELRGFGELHAAFRCGLILRECSRAIGVSRIFRDASRCSLCMFCMICIQIL